MSEKDESEPRQEAAIVVDLWLVIKDLQKLTSQITEIDSAEGDEAPKAALFDMSCAVVNAACRSRQAARDLLAGWRAQHPGERHETSEFIATDYRPRDPDMEVA